MSFAVKYSMRNCNNYYSMQFESWTLSGARDASSSGQRKN